MLSFFVDCIPPKATGNNTKGCAIIGGHARIFDTKKCKSVKAMMMAILAPYKPDKPLAGPLRLTATFVFPLNKADTATQAKREALASNGYVWHDVKPDMDNLHKILNDTMEKLGFYHNDSQIVITRGVKLRGEKTGIGITLEEITGSPSSAGALEGIK